jgi:hypothetical protein
MFMSHIHREPYKFQARPFPTKVIFYLSTTVPILYANCVRPTTHVLRRCCDNTAKIEIGIGEPWTFPTKVDLYFSTEMRFLSANCVRHTTHVLRSCYDKTVIIKIGVG